MDLKKHIASVPVEQGRASRATAKDDVVLPPTTNALHLFLKYHQQTKRNIASSSVAGPALGQTQQNHHQQQPQQMMTSAAAAAAAISPQVQTSLTQLDECIERMPVQQTQAYLYAVRHVPHLVMTESDPVRFLRFFDFDADAAAKRLVLYWNRRVEVFGDRAIRPMTMTSDGALSEDAKELFLTGTLVLLPEDNEGCSVLCFDPSRRLIHSPVARQQASFYMSQIVAENEVSQTKGLVVIAIAIDPKHDEIQQKCTRLFLKTNAIKIKAIHAFNPDTQTRGMLFQEGFVPFMMRAVAVLLLQDAPLRVHTAASKQEILADMKAFGISRQGLPRCLGGSWSYRQVGEWLNERIRLERRRHLLPMDPFNAPAATGDDEEQQLREQQQVVEDVIDDRKMPATVDSINEQSIDGENELEVKDVLQNYRQFMHKAIEQVPASEKLNFLEATQNAPDEIKENECNADLFLITEELNCWLAAKRLARYWGLRAETFETDLYKKLDLTGDGALRRMDLALIETGFAQLLPYDTCARSVLWIESSRVSSVTSGFGSHPDEARIKRCLFYMVSLLAENEKTQEEGAVLVILLEEDSRFQRTIITSLNHLASCLPVLFKRVHLLSLEPIDDKEDTKYQIDFGDSVHLHVSSSISELSNRLLSFGLELSGLPKRFGGQWGLEKFLQWKELRTRCEWGIPLGLASAQGDISGLPAINPNSNLTEIERTERKRRLNVIHTRRKRDRIRVEQDVLEESVADLMSEKTRLLEENRRLENLAQSALKITGSMNYLFTRSPFPSSGY